ncbi:MAG: LamG domain-containing protein [Acidobacteriota bacterium]
MQHKPLASKIDAAESLQASAASRESDRPLTVDLVAAPSGPSEPHAMPRRRLSSLARWLGAACLLSGLAFVGFAGQVQTKPPQPTLMPGDPGVPDLYGFDATGPGGSYEFTNPYIPPLSTSQDRRVGLVRKRVAGHNLRFHLLVPEKYAGTTQGVLDVPGPDLLSATSHELPTSSFFHNDDPNEEENASSRTVEHVAICNRSADANPSACSGDPSQDCYQLVVVTGASTLDTHDLPAIRLFSREVEVRVDQPKTGAAAIDQVTPLGSGPKMGPLLTGVGPHPDFTQRQHFQGIHDFHTPMFIGDDSRLLVVRLGFPSRYRWTDNSGQAIEGDYDPSYAYNSAPAECDIDGWDNNFKPLAFAPQDTTPTVDGKTLNTRYGFAMHPFRSPSNLSIADVQDPYSLPAGGPLNIRGRYLWMDHDGDNIFFGTLGRNLLDHSPACADPPAGQAPVCQHTYDFSCVPGTACRDDCDIPNPPAGCIEVDDHATERTTPTKGWTMMGLWTRGKMVILDSTINHADFGLRGPVQNHRLVDLYDGPPVRVGSLNEPGALGDIPYGWIDTTAQFGSTEHFFNLVPEMRPKTPRDVVWQVSAIMQSDEIAFDDSISPSTLIFSPMNALKEMTQNATYYDGVGTEMRLQNAAASDFWQIPSYGLVNAPAADRGRIEHVALGGVKARGFYLYPETSIDYQIPADQPESMDGREWLVSIFLDRKIDPPGTSRRLWTFPSGATISLVEVAGADHVQWCGSVLGSCASVALPKGNPADRWTHLAFILEQTETPANDRVRIFQDGFLFAEVGRPAGLEIAPGLLSLGGAGAAGFGGWIDEVKVVEGPFSLEEVCNHARGTLVLIPSSYVGVADNRFADLLAPFYPDPSVDPSTVLGLDAVHDALHGQAAKMRLTSDYAVCHVDYENPRAVSAHETGDSEVRSIRRRLLFPEGPVVWNQPRPDSSLNPFCLQCHHVGAPLGLSFEALTLRADQEAWADERRQPSQPERDLMGNVPAHYFGSGRPAESTAYDSDPLITDSWLDNGPLFRWKLDAAGGHAPVNWVGGAPEAGVDGDGRLVSGAWWTQGFLRGHSTVLDGVDDHVLIDDPIDIEGDEITLAAWIFLSSAARTECLPFDGSGLATPCTIVAKSGTGIHSVYWSMRVLYNGSQWQAQVRIRHQQGGIRVVTANLTSEGFDDTAWQHLTAVYSQGSVQFYLQGQPLGGPQDASHASGNHELATSPVHHVSLGSKLFDGSDPSSTPIHPFFGRIDEVHLYDRALADWEVANLVLATP